MSEIKNQVDTVCETLPRNGDRTQLHPDPLSLEAQQEAFRSGENVHTAAKRLAIQSAPDAALPPAVRVAREVVARAEAKKSEAENRLRAELQAWDRYKSLLAQIGDKKNEIANGEYRLAQCRADCANYSTDFQDWVRVERTDGWRAVFDRALSACAAEKMVGQFETWLIRAREDLAALESKASELRAEYDFA